MRLDRLDRILDHQAADMTVTVESGCPLTTLQDELASAGQWLPLDPPRPERTTVGGLVAANLGGPLRASQGGVRDLLLGLHLVGAGGTLIRGGGRVVKNVAGYDLPKLHVGALGSVGVVVQATFKVRPRPEREAAVVIGCRTGPEAADAALAVRDAIDPLWIEVAGAGGLPDGPGDGAAVAVGLGGSGRRSSTGACRCRSAPRPAAGAPCESRMDARCARAWESSTSNLRPRCCAPRRFPGRWARCSEQWRRQPVGGALPFGPWRTRRMASSASPWHVPMTCPP